MRVLSQKPLGSLDHSTHIISVFHSLCHKTGNYRLFKFYIAQPLHYPNKFQPLSGRIAIDRYHFTENLMRKCVPGEKKNKTKNTLHTPTLELFQGQMLQPPEKKWVVQPTTIFTQSII